MAWRHRLRTDNPFSMLVRVTTFAPAASVILWSFEACEAERGFIASVELPDASRVVTRPCIDVKPTPEPSVPVPVSSSVLGGMR